MTVKQMLMLIKIKSWDGEQVWTQHIIIIIIIIIINLLCQFSAGFLKLVLAARYPSVNPS